MSILPWWWRWAALGALCAMVALYTGLKVAGHYQDKIAQIEVAGKQQTKIVKQIEVRQKEVVKNVNQSVKRDIALSDDFYRGLLHPGSSQVPNLTGTPGGTDEAPKTTSPDTACNPSDGSADALVILGWQKFYSDLREAQR